MGGGVGGVDHDAAFSEGSGDDEGMAGFLDGDDDFGVLFWDEFVVAEEGWEGVPGEAFGEGMIFLDDVGGETGGGFDEVFAGKAFDGERFGEAAAAPTGAFEDAGEGEPTAEHHESAAGGDPGFEGVEAIGESFDGFGSLGAVEEGGIEVEAAGFDVADDDGFGFLEELFKLARGEAIEFPVGEAGEIGLGLEGVGEALAVEVEVAVFGFCAEGGFDEGGTEVEDPVAEVEDVGFGHARNVTRGMEWDVMHPAGVEPATF